MLLNTQSLSHFFPVMGSAVHVQTKSDNEKSNVKVSCFTKSSPVKFENKKNRHSLVKLMKEETVAVTDNRPITVNRSVAAVDNVS